MNFIILYIFFLILTLIGYFFLIKKHKECEPLVIFWIMFLFFICPPISFVTNNDKEYERFNKRYMITSHLISVYDAEKDVDGTVLLYIKDNVQYINEEIEDNKKHLDSWLFGDMYVEEIANTEPLAFDYNNLINR